MNSVISLKMLVIGQYRPHELIRIIKEADSAGIDLHTPIQLELNVYNTTLKTAYDFNQRWDGWWGTPYPMAAFTYNPQLFQQ